MKRIIQRFFNVPDQDANQLEIDYLHEKIGKLADLVQQITSRTRHNMPCAAKIHPLANAHAVCSECGWGFGYHQMELPFDRSRFEEVA